MCGWKMRGIHGTGVVSYFVFLRWLIVLNFVMFLIYFFVIIFPHAAFPLKQIRDLNIAPNQTRVDELFLSKFPNRGSENSLKNKQPTFTNEDLLSSLGTLIKDYSIEDILDYTVSYDKRNYTSSERRNFSQFCENRYNIELQNRRTGFISTVQDTLQGTGWMQSTMLLLGHYPSNEISYFGMSYSMSLAIIVALFISFLMCLFMMVQYSSHGVQETILARKSNYLAYSNILFCSWDYCIEDKKSSVVRHKSILQEIKSTLSEERRKQEVKKWSKSQKVKVCFLRVAVNIFVISVLCGCYYLIYKVVHYQLQELKSNRLNDPGISTLCIEYLSPIVITVLNIPIPLLFMSISKFEMYDTHTEINMALFRIVFLRLSSVFVLVAMLYQQISCEPRDVCKAGITASCQSPICWETYVGQQLYKLVITDFFVYIIMFIGYDLPRDLIVRRWDNKVTQMVGRQVFDLPTQVLSLVYSQTLCWLGVIYSPLLPMITLLKFIVVFHVKKVMVLQFSIPSPTAYKASRSNAMFMMILMVSFFSLSIIHGYSLSGIEPSPACSPFRHYYRMAEAIPDVLTRYSPSLASFVTVCFGGFVLIPVIILLCIAIYYYWTIVIAHKKMAKVLKAQILLEGRDKRFLLNRLTEAAKSRIANQ